MKKLAPQFSYALLIIALGIIASSPAKADRYYTFIKTTCDKASQTVGISIPYLNKDEDPEDIIEKIRNGQIKDMYYFDDLAKASKKITCDLGNNYIVSFEAYKSQNHPRNDNIEVFIDGKHTPVWFGSLPMEAEIHVSNLNDYTVRECSLWPAGPPIKEANCRYKHIVDNKLFGQQSQQGDKQ